MSKSDDKPTLPELDLVESKREFIETFFKRGAEFTEELMRENEKLRFRVVQLEEERRALASSAHTPHDKPGAGALRELVARIEQLEVEREGLMSRFAGVERLNRDIYDRYHDIERENNNLANLYVASFQLHSTMELRELTQIILEILLNFVGAKTFAIQLVDDEHRKLRTLAAEGVERATRPRGRRSARGASARSSEAGTTTSTASGCARAPIWRIWTVRSSSCRSRFATRSSASSSSGTCCRRRPRWPMSTTSCSTCLAAHAASALQGAWLAAELKGRAPHLWAAADQV